MRKIRIIVMGGVGVIYINMINILVYRVTMSLIGVRLISMNVRISSIMMDVARIGMVNIIIILI